MYFLPGLSDKFGKPVFDVHMDVFKIDAPGEFPFSISSLIFSRPSTMLPASCCVMTPVSDNILPEPLS